MASLRIWSIVGTLVSILVVHLPFSIGSVIGVNYGLNGDNLPSPQSVIAFFEKCGINYMRLFEPKPDILEASRHSSVHVSLGVRNQDVPNLASSQDAANQWVNTYVVPYNQDVFIDWIVVGNEIIPGDQSAYVAQAMKNIHIALNSTGNEVIQVTTSISMAAMATSYPPSAGAFGDDVVNVMKDVAKILSQTGAPLMANVYPYISYASDPSDISLEYATFQPTNSVVDGSLTYTNLFDAMVDSIYAALEKIDFVNVDLIIGETGWPTAGNEPYTSIQNAQTYNQNLVTHLQTPNGTPRRPGQILNAFIFAMFNEDQKPHGVEQNWGLYYPNMSPVYPFYSC